MMGEFLRNLAIIYGSTTIASLLFNKIYFYDVYKEAYEKSKRKLVYRDLSVANGVDLARLHKYMTTKKNQSFIYASIPIFQVLYTISIICTDKNVYKRYFEKETDRINKNELYTRKLFLNEIKKANTIPIEIQSKLEDEKYLPNEEEYFYVKYLNNKKDNKEPLEKKLNLLRKDNDTNK